MENYLNLLHEMPLFDNIELTELPGLLNSMRAKVEGFHKDAIIRSEGDTVDFIGIVLEGTIQVMQYDFGGNRRIISSFSAGNLFAEAIACAEAAELPFTIQAISDCVILFLSEKQILQAHELENAIHYQLVQNLLRIVSKKNLLLNQKIYCMSRKTTAEKLMYFLETQAKQQHTLEFSIPFDRQALADYLGVERSAMAAEISKLQKQGLIETKRNWFRLNQSPELVDYADNKNRG